MSDVASPVPVAAIPAPIPYAGPDVGPPAGIEPPAPDHVRVKGSLRARTIKGTVWTTAGYGTAQVIRLGVNLILTRLLVPQMFGLMTLVNIFIQGLQGFSDVGIGPAIIQSKRGDDPAFLNTAWTIQVLRGFALGAISAAIAWPVAKLYGEPQLVSLLPAAGLAAVIAGFNSTALFTLNRHLDVFKLTMQSLVGQVAGAVVMVVLAKIYPSVWALLAGNLAAAVAVLVLSHFLLPGTRNRFQWDRSAYAEMISFGRWIFVSTVLTFLALQADRLIFGKLISLTDLGVYGVAAMMAALPTQALLKLGGVVVFPAYSRAKAGGSNFQDVFDRVRLPLLAGAALVTTALVAGGQQLIEFLYDPRYHRAGWMLQLLAVSGWFQVMQVTNGSALLALGAPRSVAVGNMVKLATMVIFVPLGFWWKGLLGGILGIILSDVLKYVASVYLVARHGLHMLGKDVIVSSGVAVLSVACLAAANWTEARWAAHWAATHVAPAGKLAAKIGPLLALGVVTVLSCAAWLPLVARSLRSRKAVS
jgi:O-antigen/teichoic acid export membrane protein